MIKNIVLPEKIGSHYLFSKRIVGFDVGRTHVNATQLYVHGKKIVIEKCIDEKLEPGTNNNHNERVTAAISHILQQVTYDSIHVTLSSSVAVFKELKLPFIDYNKIKMVIDFEVEPLLPFPASDAVIDFIITKQNSEEQSSEILVAAVQKNHIAQLLQQFHDAGADPEVITIDLFSLYGLYEKLPLYAGMTDGVILLDLGSNATRIAYILNGQLRLIRSLPKGIFSQAKLISESLRITPNEVLTQLMRFGLDTDKDPQYNKAITDAFTAFWSDLSFTLNSFTSQTENGVHTILLVGGGADIKGLPAFITNISGIQCEVFKIQEIVHTSDVTIAQSNGISNSSAISLSAAFPSPITANFNLRQKEFSYPAATSIVNKQIIVASVLVLLIFGSLIAHSFFQLRRLSGEAKAAEQEVIGMLRERFKKIPEDEPLEEAVKMAGSEVKKDEQLWFSIASPSRVSFLRYLLELTSNIDKEGLGFSIDKLKITEKGMKLEAHVKNYDALILLKKGLRQSKLFLPPSGELDKPDFIMDLRFAKNK